MDAHTATEEDQAGQPSNEMQRMLSCSRRQEQHIAAQQQDIEELKARLAFTEAQLSQSVSTAAALQVKAQSRRWVGRASGKFGVAGGWRAGVAAV